MLLQATTGIIIHDIITIHDKTNLLWWVKHNQYNLSF